MRTQIDNPRRKRVTYKWKNGDKKNLAALIDRSETPKCSGEMNLCHAFRPYDSLLGQRRRRTQCKKIKYFILVLMVDLLYSSSLVTAQATLAPVQFSPTTTQPIGFPSMNSSMYPTNSPSTMPTTTSQSTTIPLFTNYPSQQSTDSRRPTTTSFPTTTSDPTFEQSSTQTDFPSMLPSVGPTPYPSLDAQSTSTTILSQRFNVQNGREFDEIEQDIFQNVMESFTEILAEQVVESNISSILTEPEDNPTLAYGICEFLSQRLERGQDVATPPPTSTPSGNSVLSRRIRTAHDQSRNLEEILIDITVIQVDYSLFYYSNYVNVTTFPDRFLTLNSQNLVNLTQRMQAAGLNVSDALAPFITTLTKSPSAVPSLFPPSTAPSPFPSYSPTEYPSTFPSTNGPSYYPSLLTSDPTNTPRPTPQPRNGGLSYLIILALAFGCGAGVVLIVLCVASWRWRRRSTKEDRRPATGVADDRPLNHVIQSNASNPSHLRFNTSSQYPYSITKSVENVHGVISPSESLLSNPSLLSTGNYIGGDSGDEVDNTHYLADEFDQYKDQNLEKMRNEIEGTVSGVDGMMSQAVTKALMDDDESRIDRNNLYWGGQGDPTEIEATALCEVHDWIKREEDATIEERRGFMQETLNKMVSSVRHGIMGPDLASQTIHECAALLGLQLASELDEVSLIVTGMRKTATKQDLMAGFCEFGEIDDAAVSSNSRGFGFIRFESPKAVQRALAKFKREEIVVQDVAVTIKVLSSEDSGRPVVGSVPSREGSTGPSTADMTEY